MNPYFLILKSDQNEKQSYVRYQPDSASGNIKNCPVPTWLCSLCVFYIIKPIFPGFNPVIRRIYTVAVHNTEHIAPSEEKPDALYKILPHQVCTEFHTTLSRYTQIVSSLCNWRRDWFQKDLLSSEIKKETNSIQIQNGVLGSDCKDMTVLLTLSTLVTCRKYVKAHTESA